MLTLVEKVLVLAEVPLFAQTRTADLAHLAAVARDTELARGEVLFREGDSADALHVVLSGRVRLEREDGSNADATAGVLGAFALLDQKPRRWTATATEPSRVLTVDGDAFVDVISDHVAVARGVLRVLASRARGWQQQIGVDGTAEDLEIG